MTDSVAAQVEQLTRFGAYAFGQLRALHADHRVCLEFPGVAHMLPQSEVWRGHRDGERWLADLHQRYAQELPAEYRSGRGSAAITARLLGDL
jgi:hypothetical protein